MRVERVVVGATRARLLVRLDPAERARYAAAAMLAVPPGRRPRAGFGSARRPDRPPRLGGELRKWRAAVAAGLADATVVETGDVSSCYRSIGPAALERLARASGGDPGPLLAFLGAARAAGVQGLPVGPSASSYLADRLLGIADDAARHAGVSPLRWVDDVVLLGGPRSVDRAAAAWRRALTELGLEPHEGKRRRGPAPDMLDLWAPSHDALAARGIIRLP